MSIFPQKPSSLPLTIQAVLDTEFMYTKRYEMGLILVLALVLCSRATAQSNCSRTLVGLSSCAKYVTGNSSAPSPSCCTSLDNVVQSQPQCLCPLLNSGAGFALGIAINRTLALALPAACNVQTPPVSQCDAVANGPALPPSPPETSTDAPESSPKITIPSAPSGSKTVPETNGNTSDGSTVTTLVYLTVVTLFIAVWIHF